MRLNIFPRILFFYPLILTIPKTVSAFSHHKKNSARIYSILIVNFHDEPTDVSCQPALLP
ncbi:hypothetical protein AD939_10815 [Gluconobacter oxydans]|nr:hypothetical protein AD939_10815 [Gluconobacter oxydans]